MTGRISQPEHYSVALKANAEEWFPANCSCGWQGGIFPTAEDACDALMEHVYDSASAIAAALSDLAGGFLTAYEAASVSDEEGLLVAVDPDEMRQLWHRVDEAATDLRQFLTDGAVPGA